MNRGPVREQFEAEGYLVVKGLLDPARDIAPVKDAYTELLDALLAVYAGEASAAALPERSQLSFPARLAAALGASQGRLLHHIDPALGIFDPAFQWRDDLPDPRMPEVFNLIRHSAVGDILEALLGERITASPVHHINIKLGLDHLKLMRQVAESAESGVCKTGFRGFHVGKTYWHMDAAAGLRDSHASRIINAWIPITRAVEKNGCLRVIPASHMHGAQYPPYPAGLDRWSIALPVEPGDVVFLDNMLVHSSAPNSSRSDYRWAFNFRYLPTGQPNGRPFLPEFIVRDRTAPENELRDARTWAQMWRGCLRYLSRKGPPITLDDASRLSPQAAGELTAYWKRLAPNHSDWVQLGER